MKKLLFLLLLILLLGAAGFAYCAWLVQQAGKGRVYDRVDSIPPREWGVVLGTSQLRRDGGPNPFFNNRIAAAARLYHMGKVKRLLVSGDNHAKGYNEPVDMKRALTAQAVPSSAIYLDNAGLRTLDSIVRAARIFKLKHFTVISQRDHDNRALLIALHYGISAQAYAADDVPFHLAQSAHVREWLAEIKVVLDLYVLHTRPKFLGRPEPIGERVSSFKFRVSKRRTAWRIAIET